MNNIPNENKTSFQQHIVVKLPRGIKIMKILKNEFKIKKPNETFFNDNGERKRVNCYEMK